ncbi:cupin domain-containing protein [Flavobacterium sp. MR2016-29]|uniref:cupin domain-containing protein n=1 Tax=Flavobacterium sp. MR2016-29 TaxID=2783795 RepID=UPI001889FEC8|nr:cupin domain-containing protein [Flavobacterium sp. MR2016-29]MBF4491155.1 cupin domain-containing protein [Flavobacterium sp. MR2016-29]
MKLINLTKSTAIAFLFCIAIAVVSCKDGKEQKADSVLIFPKGDKITNKNFTGEVWLNNLAQADSINQNAIGSVTFEPGARTKWHSHPAGQIILALDGVGYYQERGKPKIIVNKGDVIKCPTDIPHWHGASADKKFIQVAITGREKGETIWLEQVSDTEYSK